MKKILVISNSAASYHSPIFKKIAKNNYLHVIYYSNDLYNDQYNKEYDTVIKKERKLFKGYDYTFIQSSFPIIKFFQFLYIFISIIYSKKINNIFVFGYDHPRCWASVILGKILNKNILWRGEAIPRKNHPLKKEIKNMALKIFFSFCDKIFYSCKKNKNVLKDYTSKHIYPYPCSVDNSYFRKQFSNLKNKKKKLIKGFKLGPKTFKIVSVCRLTKRKNLSYLLREIYKFKIKNIEILLVGNGPERENLKILSKKFNLKVKFFGFQNQHNICKILSISDLYCLVSNFDASPKSINEAMNFKLPIITRNTIGTAGDLVINGFNGYIIKDNIKLGKILKRLIINKNKLNYLSKNSYVTLDNFFSHEICIKNVINHCK